MQEDREGDDDHNNLFVHSSKKSNSHSLLRDLGDEEIVARPAETLLPTNR